MTQSTAKIGLGAALLMGDGGSPEAFAIIANVVNIDGPSEQMEVVDVTHLQSTGGFREKIPHLKDGGEVSFTLHFNPTEATHDDSTGLKAKFDARTLTNFKVDLTDQFASDNIISFAGYVTGLGLAVAVDNVIEQQATITVTGAVTRSTE